MRYGFPADLRGFSRNVGGLRSFVSQVDVPGAAADGGELQHLDRIWAGQEARAAREPGLCKGHFDVFPEFNRRVLWRLWLQLREMIEEDARDSGAVIPQSLGEYLRLFDKSA